MRNIQSKTIVFITGAFVGNNCWDEWRSYFENKGFETLAPPWPHKDASPEELRNRQPDPGIASIRLAALTEYFENIIRKLPEKPILIGHSMGGLITQILLQRDLAVAGVAIHSVPPLGVFTFRLSFYKASWGALGFFTSVRKSFLMSFRQWQYAFTNTMNFEDQREAYYNFAVPESKRLVRDGLTSAARVDFGKAHEPLLLISGSSDNCIPASLNYSNYRKYKKGSSVIDYREFPGRNHFVLGQPTWREEAGYILAWLEQL
jgi:pimeloyl-ACP methyl ester carboxylesterase